VRSVLALNKQGKIPERGRDRRDSGRPFGWCVAGRGRKSSAAALDKFLVMEDAELKASLSDTYVLGGFSRTRCRNVRRRGGADLRRVCGRRGVHARRRSHARPRARRSCSRLERFVARHPHAFASRAMQTGRRFASSKRLGCFGGRFRRPPITRTKPPLTGGRCPGARAATSARGRVHAGHAR